MEPLNSRREFLAITGAAGALFLLADPTEVRDALRWALARADAEQQAWQNLTPAQAATLEAATSRLIPSDDGTPGAREAGVIHFIDRALGGFGQGAKPAFEQCSEELDRRAGDGPGSFAALPTARQDALLHEIEQEAYFGPLRTFTMIGTFSLPSYGGNRDWVGWDMIRQGRQGAYQPPFGWYDAQSGAGG